MKETKSERNSESECNSRERETHTQRMRDSEDKEFGRGSYTLGKMASSRCSSCL